MSPPLPWKSLPLHHSSILLFVSSVVTDQPARRPGLVPRHISALILLLILGLPMFLLLQILYFNVIIVFTISKQEVLLNEIGKGSPHTLSVYIQ
jgi:hypothetical protein